MACKNRTYQKVIGNPECESSYRDHPGRVNDHCICILDQKWEEHGGACFGDSGGPLAVRRRGRWTTAKCGIILQPASEDWGGTVLLHRVLSVKAFY